jgi:hypothetical protein
VGQLTPEDPRFGQALTQATEALDRKESLGDRSAAVDVLGQLASRDERAREALRQAAREDPAWRIRAKARSLLRELTGY